MYTLTISDEEKANVMDKVLAKHHHNDNPANEEKGKKQEDLINATSPLSELKREINKPKLLAQVMIIH